MKSQSALEKLRMHYQPKLPKIFHEVDQLVVNPSGSGEKSSVELAKLFPNLSKSPIIKFIQGSPRSHEPLKVGVVLSGGQAAGGHNVITGLFDALKKLNTESTLFGFLNGPKGIIDQKYIELTGALLTEYRNQGGFDLIGSGRAKIETIEHFQAVEKSVLNLSLDALVVIGGDDSNTNAAHLAEYFIGRNIKTRVVGIPKTIDGDLKSEEIEISFGFDSACKTYSEIIGNVLRDALSQGKYYFFIKMMGRSASHVALECALQTHPNLALIGEEIESKQQTIQDITKMIADLICTRSSKGKDYGVILIPEGLVEFIPEIKVLIQELNLLFSSEDHVKALEEKKQPEEKIHYLECLLSPESAACLKSLPKDIQSQFLMDRDPHGNVQVSKIETERLFIESVKQVLDERQKLGIFPGKFSAQPLFCGYEGRSCLPSNFDAQYCYALGHLAALLADSGVTGYMAALHNLAKPVEEWQASGVPLVSLMDMEMRKGKLKPVIKKALVHLEGRPFTQFAKVRDQWLAEDDYRYPGPIQFFGPSEITDAITLTLLAESEKRG